MSAYGIPPGDCDIVERAKVTKAIVLVWPCVMWEPCSSQVGTQRVSPGYVDLLDLDCTHCIIVVVTRVLVITFSLLLVTLFQLEQLSAPVPWSSAQCRPPYRRLCRIGLQIGITTSSRLISWILLSESVPARLTCTYSPSSTKYGVILFLHHIQPPIVLYTD